jgi:hypothetical protein
MRSLVITLLATSLTLPAMAFQNPEQQPTSNPDAAKQRQPNPPSPDTRTSQQRADVPGQPTDSKSPDMATQRHDKSKKKSKKQKSTGTSSTT